MARKEAVIVEVKKQAKKQKLEQTFSEARVTGTVKATMPSSPMKTEAVPKNLFKD